MVPLWLALHLRVQDKCKIIAPDWMNVESLKTVLQREKEDLGHFEVLPFHYVEIAEQLLTVCDGTLIGFRGGGGGSRAHPHNARTGQRVILPTACDCARC